MTVNQIAEVPGLYYVPNFLTPEQLNEITQELNQNQSWVGVTKNQNSRKVRQYGYEYVYSGGPPKPTDPIPVMYQLFNNRSTLPTELQQILADWEPNQLLINRYLPGQGISHHTDHLKYFNSIVVGITIGSGIEMEFVKAGQTVPIYLEPNSLYVMSKDARYKWTHGIRSRNTDTVNGVIINRGLRDSLTYRETFNHQK